MVGCQHTLLQDIVLSGVGLHRGEHAQMRLRPAKPDAGVLFFREDLSVTQPFVAHADAVVATTLCTTLAHPHVAGARVQTIEHLLAALSAMGIDNCEVRMGTAEVPVLDGSAAPIVDAIERAGRRPQPAQRRHFAPRATLSVADGERYARLLPPAPGQRALEVHCRLEFDHPCIPTTPFVYAHGQEAFVREVAPARTWGFLQDLESLRAAGLALGGSLDNAVVFDAGGVKNPEGLRFDDECARHKVLDALGDLSLTGVVLSGRLELYKSGHGLHVALAKAIVEQLRHEAP